MYYEIYIDVLFLENFLINSLLLFIVSKIENNLWDKKRIFLSSAVGAIGTCLLVIWNLSVFIEYLIAFFILDLCMILIVAGKKRIEQILRMLIIFFITTIMAGGIIGIFQPYLKSASLFYFIVIVTYFSIKGFWEIILCFKKHQKNIFMVTIISVNRKVCINVLEDTGNQLCDPISGDSVCVIDENEAKVLLGIESEKEIEKFLDKQKIRYIPYHTILGHGVMPVFRAEKMILHLHEEKMVERPLIGISKEPVSERQLYQMILNSDILGGAKNVSESGSTTTV